MHARGFKPEVMTSGVVDREEKLQVPLSLAQGSCLALGALRSNDDAASSSLMLGLITQDGALLATDGPGKQPPLLFHCAALDTGTRTSMEGAAKNEQLHAVIGTAQGRGRARFTLIMGTEPAEGTP